MARLGSVLRVIGFAMLLLILTRALVFSTFVVQGDSMQETLCDGDNVLVNHLIYDLRSPTRGEVIIFDCPQEDQAMVKRVIAKPGEIIEISDGTVYINGVPLSEPYLSRRGDSDLSPQKVGAGEVFVMGDNRSYSNDSRDFGPVPKNRIRGRFVLAFWPLPEILDGK